MKNEVKVSVAAVIKKGNKYLLVKQGKGEHHEGLWAFPGGQVESNETLDYAVKRETKEETTLDVSVENFLCAQILKNNHPMEFKQYTYVIILFYNCKAVKGNALPGSDVEKCIWVTLEEMKNYKMRPTMYNVIKKLK